jgi:hypothetical protein
MWKSYFGPYARVVGLDIREECKRYEEDQVSVRVGNQSDELFLTNVVEEFGPPDIVIDDGSHISRDMIASFQFLYNKMSLTAKYVVEDVYFSYNSKLGGGVHRPGTFVEFAKDLIDQLHARHTEGAIEANEFTEHTTSIHIYDGLIVFERGRHEPLINLHRGQK